MNSSIKTKLVIAVVLLLLLCIAFSDKQRVSWLIHEHFYATKISDQKNASHNCVDQTVDFSLDCKEAHIEKDQPK